MPQPQQFKLDPGFNNAPKKSNVALYVSIGVGVFIVIVFILIFQVFLKVEENEMQNTVNEFRDKVENARRADSIRIDSIMRLQEELMNE